MNGTSCIKAMNAPSSLRVETVPHERREQALAFLLGTESPDAVSGIGGEQHEEVHLWWARLEHQIVGVTLAEPTSPTTITLVPPRLSASAPTTTREQLWASMLASLANGPQMRCAVVLLADDEEPSSIGLLQTGGFERVTPIDFLMATGMPSEPTSPITLQQADSGQRKTFDQILLETTRDRDSSEAPAWVRWRGEAGVSLELDDVEMARGGDCYFVQYQARTVGVLVLYREVEAGDRTLEVRYLGIRPTQRRQGYAAAALQAVRYLAAAEGRLVLAAVDHSHAAAVQAYSRAGFHAWRRRMLWAKLLGGVGGRWHWPVAARNDEAG